MGATGCRYRDGAEAIRAILGNRWRSRLLLTQAIVVRTNKNTANATMVKLTTALINTP